MQGDQKWSVEGDGVQATDDGFWHVFSSDNATTAQQSHFLPATSIDQGAVYFTYEIEHKSSVESASVIIGNQVEHPDASANVLEQPFSRNRV